MIGPEIGHYRQCELMSHIGSLSFIGRIFVSAVEFGPPSSVGHEKATRPASTFT